MLLKNDVDLLNEEWESIGFLSKDSILEPVEPNNQDNKAFKGIFDGCNHIINNLLINSTEHKYNGMFGLAIDASIRNVTIGKNSQVVGKLGAGIVGYLYGLKGNIYNCTNYANTNCSGIAVTIVGRHTISNCKNYGNVNRAGIVNGSNGNAGWEEWFNNYSQTIVNCANYGNITNEYEETLNRSGGIAAYLNGKIINCLNKGNISGNFTNSGGIAGTIDGTIENCYNTGKIAGSRAGGILNAATTKGASAINCYSVGIVTAQASIGDIIGGGKNLERNKIINCYTKSNIFTATDLGEAFKEDIENTNNGYPILFWE